MKQSHVLVAILAVLVLCGSLLAEAPLAERVPGDSMAYVGWAGRSHTFDGSLMGQLLKEPGLSKFVEAARAAVDRQVGPRRQKVVSCLWDIGLILWQHPLAAATFPSEDGEAKAPDGCLWVDLGKDKQAFQKSLEQLLAEVRLELEEVSIGDVTLQKIKGELLGPGPKLCFGFVDNYFLLTSEASARRVLELKKEDSLAAGKKFAACMDDLGGENTQLVLYVDVPALRAFIAKASGSSAEAAQRGLTALKAIGYDKVSAFASVTRVVDRNMYVKARLFSAAPHTGVMSLLAGTPLKESDYQNVPTDADFFLAANLSPARLLREIKSAAGVIAEDPNALKPILSKVDGLLGVSVEKDIAASLGDTWVLSSASSHGGFLTGTSLSIAVKDSAKFTETKQSVEAAIRDALQRRPTTQPAGNREMLPPFELQTISDSRAEIRYLSPVGGQMPVAPAWTVYKDRLIVSLWPQVAQSVVTINGSDPITADATYKKLRQRISGKPWMIGYVNMPSLVGKTYNLMLLGSTVGSNELTRKTGIRFRPEWLPTMLTLRKYLQPQICAVSADAEGIVFESFGPFPTLGMEAACLVPGFAPEIIEARRKAKRAVSLSRARGIAMGCMLYHTQHETMPPDLATLVREGCVGTDYLVSPVSGKRAPRFDRDRNVLVGDCDYILVGLGDLDDLDGEHRVLMVYENPDNYKGKGTVAAFADGHAEWLSAKEFRAAMDYTLKALAGESE